MAVNVGGWDVAHEHPHLDTSKRYELVFSLSHEDTQEKNDWKLRFNGVTS